VQTGSPEPGLPFFYKRIPDRTPLSESRSIMISMILPVFALFLQPVNPLHFSLEDLRLYFTRQLADNSVIQEQSSPVHIHRYPVIQCKQVKNSLLVIGIGQGADLLWAVSSNGNELLTGQSTCTIIKRDQEIRNEKVGISESLQRYEFLTPWIALNQQNAKKFYDLKGKPERDAFMQKILNGALSTFARSIDCDLREPLICRSKVRFRRERIHDENVMVFLGTFETNLRVPDYLGIGQSISKGFGTLRLVPDIPKTSL
jgi:hypothetical protein